MSADETCAGHLSRFQLDLLVLDEPGPGARQHLDACPACRERLASLTADQRSFAASAEPLRAARDIAQRLEERSLAARLRRIWRPRTFALAGALVSVALLTVLAARPVTSDGLRMKGGPVLEAWLKHADLPPRLLAPGQPIAPGDRVQLAFRAADGLTLSVFLLERDCEARRVGLFSAQALPGVLPNSWTLADSDGGRVYVAFSEKAVEAADFAAALRRATGGCDPTTAPPIDAPGFVARGVVLRAGGQP